MSLIIKEIVVNEWKQEAIIIAGGNDRGNQLNQLSYPEGIFIDVDQTIYIVDYQNHRIVEWKSLCCWGWKLSNRKIWK